MAEESTPNKLRLLLVSAEAELLDVPCDEVTLPGRAGEMGVFPGHAAFLGTLQPGVLSYRDGSNVQRVALSGGFCEILNGSVRVLVDSATVSSDQVDVEQLRADLAAAQKAAEDATPEELVAAQDHIKAVEARLEVVG